MKDIGPANKILGMQIVRDRHSRTLFISQSIYIEKVLKRFNINHSKPVLTPLAQNFKLSLRDLPKTEDKIGYMQKIPYASVVGSLMYAMIYTCPD